MRSLPLLLLGLALTAACAAIASGGDLTGAGVPRFVLLYFAAALLALWALWGVAREPAAVPAAGADAPEPPWARRALWVVLCVAIACRVALIAAEPSLSQDCRRYLWEGRVTLSGNNPYALPPSSEALLELREADPELWLQINHREVPAIYGPLLQLLFAGLAWLGGGLVPFKLAFVGFDLLLAGLVFRRLARARGSPFWILLYLWHPLIPLEIAGQCHLEVVPVALLFLALELEDEGRPRLAALALGAAIATKYLPVLVVPAFLLARPTWRERGVRLLLIALPGVVALLPFLAAGSELGTGLSAYGTSWRFNDGAFRLIDEGLRGLGISQAFCRQVLPAFVEVPAGFDPADHANWMLIPPKLVVGGLVVGIVGWASLPREGVVDLERAAFLAGACFLVLSPTVHPWYALWVIPFLPVLAARQAPTAPAWTLLTLLLPLSYAATVGPEWEDRAWVRNLQYAPFVVIWCATRVRVPS